MIPDEAAIRLAELARREFRAPGRQAAILVMEGLERTRLDHEPSPEAQAERVVAKRGRGQLTLASTGPEDGAP